MNILSRMSKYHIPNLGKACEVLDLISSRPGGYLLKDLTRELEIPRTTALRITETLLDADYLARNEDGALTLGPAMVRIGVRAFDHLEIRGFARPVLKQLAADTGESTHLALLNGKNSILVEVADSSHPVRIASRPGTMVDLHSSSTGKVFLAFSIQEPDSFCRSLTLTAYTECTDSSLGAVLAGVEQTRRDGFAMDDVAYLSGVRCIAAPVFNAFGKTIAAVGITASTSTFPKRRIPVLEKMLKTATAEIAARMGFGR